MADNVVLNAGAGGATLATDDVAGVHYQRVKLVDGTLEGTGAIGGDATNGLDVDVTRVTGTVTTDPSDRALRDVGKVDVASLDQYTPQDVDSGAGTVNAFPVVLKGTAAGGADLGTATVPIRTDPTGTTTQPVSGTVTANAGTGPWPVTDNGGSLTVDGSVSLAAELPAGTNNIGDVDVLSLPALPAGTNNIGDVDVLSLPALPAGTNNIGDVDVLSLPALPTGTNSIGTVVDGGSGKTLKRAVVNTSTSGADVVAAVATKRIKVYSYAVQATGTVNVYLRDGGAGSALTLTWNLQAREGASVSGVNPPAFLFGTTAGNALQVVLSAAVTVGIEVTYWDDDGS